MKLIISIIFLIISICIAYKINNINNNDNHNIESPYDNYFINFLPYDESCSNQIAGAGFGSYYNTCFFNFSADVGSNSIYFTDNTQQHVNLSSYYHNQYCGDAVYSKIYKNGECGYYEYAHINYAVSLTKEPPIPKNSFVIITWDEFCKSRINYWYATSGTSIPDYAINQTSTYKCVGTDAYVTTCDGVEPGHTTNCGTGSYTRTCGFLINPNQEIYCTSSE